MQLRCRQGHGSNQRLCFASISAIYILPSYIPRDYAPASGWGTGHIVFGSDPVWAWHDPGLTWRRPQQCRVFKKKVFSQIMPGPWYFLNFWKETNKICGHTPPRQLVSSEWFWSFKVIMPNFYTADHICTIISRLDQTKVTRCKLNFRY